MFRNMCVQSLTTHQTTNYHHSSTKSLTTHPFILSLKELVEKTKIFKETNDNQFNQRNFDLKRLENILIRTNRITN